MSKRSEMGPRKRRIGASRSEVDHAKTVWQPGTMLSPVPVVMITTADAEGRGNIATVAWAGTVCSEPPMLSISLRPERYTYELLKASGEFVVNVPAAHQVRWVDYCGVVSGRDVDKFARTGLTAGACREVGCPLILECPLNLECKVQQEVELCTHTMFLAAIVAVQVSSRFVTASGRLALENAGLAAYAHGAYYMLGKRIGHFGFSVKRREVE